MGAEASKEPPPPRPVKRNAAGTRARAATAPPALGSLPDRAAVPHAGLRPHTVACAGARARRALRPRTRQNA